MSINFEDLRLQVATLGDVELEALAIAIEKEVNRRRDDQKLASVNGCYELKGIKSGKKTHYYWYLRYRQNGKLKSKYLGKGLEGDKTPPMALRDKGASYIRNLV
ncbi:hypothetical protein [[Limnothrix rosea] IAM M-220]|uniref:hypothetical protein n=1 Tax=[Limnothrix rosea] IAM M-220 TaxID=454133 RepID=UPI0009637A06|nr:hypothetical protein [[Limnothrix rosea] IAM M-220]OKH12309.1 hypothetical protein NIES208_16310 [[Limnothrix rosea] IAM M-220]